MTDRVAIAGIGMTSFGKFLDRSVSSLPEEVVRVALEDAGIGAERVDRVFLADAAAGLVTGQEMVSSEPGFGFVDPTRLSASSREVMAAFEAASIGPEDIHVAEVHDASAPGEQINYEMVEICTPGEVVGLLRSGATGLGGRITVNPSGGLISKDHPIGATGTAQIFELAQQLRGAAGALQRESAKVAFAQNSGRRVGGDSAAAVVSALVA